MELRERDLEIIVMDRGCHGSENRKASQEVES